MNASRRSILAPALLAATAIGLALPQGTMAQQQPLTSHMMGGQEMPAAPAEPAFPAPPPANASPAPVPAPAMASMAGAEGSDVGDVTRHLLQMQVDGRHAGQQLRTLGTEASASYRRYLDSFNHPIPDFFETTVGKNGSNGS